jgi:acetyltransferase-like isoleucine patch superfamily enzyme
MPRPSKLVSALAAALLPSALAVWVLRACGHKIGPGCRIGFSLLWVDRLLLMGSNRIGHGNLIACRRLCMGPLGRLGRLNAAVGPFTLLLRADGSLGNSNKIVRGPVNLVTSGPATLLVDQGGRLTSNHRIDCTRSVTIGVHSILAGIGTQVWTHGYVHDTSGPGRYRIDGAVHIGDNVYVGAGCIISMGVEICAGVIVGAGTTISRSITEQGLYVSAAVRQLPRPAPPETRSDLVQEANPALCERVYRKTSARR